MSCEAFAAPHVRPGWVCCACAGEVGRGAFNGWASEMCRECGHPRCPGLVKPDKVKPKGWDSRQVFDNVTFNEVKTKIKKLYAEENRVMRSGRRGRETLCQPKVFPDE